MSFFQCVTLDTTSLEDCVWGVKLGLTNLNWGTRPALHVGHWKQLIHQGTQTTHPAVSTENCRGVISRSRISQTAGHQPERGVLIYWPIHEMKIFWWRGACMPRPLRFAYIMWHSICIFQNHLTVPIDGAPCWLGQWNIKKLTPSPFHFAYNVYCGYIFSVCILGYEPDGSGGCKPCDKDWFREKLSAPSCTACSTLDVGFITQTTGSNSSSLCGEFVLLTTFDFLIMTWKKKVVVLILNAITVYRRT